MCHQNFSIGWHPASDVFVITINGRDRFWSRVATQQAPELTASHEHNPSTLHMVQFLLKEIQKLAERLSHIRGTRKYPRRKGIPERLRPNLTINSAPYTAT